MFKKVSKLAAMTLLCVATVCSCAKDGKAADPVDWHNYSEVAKYFGLPE